VDPRIFNGESLVAGEASGEILFADVGLSFMGGTNPATGEVTDTHHPLHGQSVANKILAIPSGRGSCAGSLVIFELLTNGHAPKALVFHHKEAILTLGVMIANELFALGIPVICLAEKDFESLQHFRYATVRNGSLALSLEAPSDIAVNAPVAPLNTEGFQLSEVDRRFLDGEFGDAARIAMRVIIRAAQLEGSDSLIDVDMAHIDGCFYQGPGSLLFARKLCDLGALVRIPATMNALCVDRQRWKSQGVVEALGLPSDELADCYVKMGVRPTYTCAPYLLDGAPTFGQQIAWAESNAVVFANSVIGARTLKYPDYLDILVAITGRAPNADCHVGSKRRATMRIGVSVSNVDDSLYPLLGYHVGKIATNDIPLVCGLEGFPVTHDDLKAFGAAFATTSAAAMFHILGITPEAATVADACAEDREIETVVVTREDLLETWRELNNATSDDVDLVSLGNPHFSLTEIERLAELCSGRTKADGAALIVTCGREVYAKAKERGFVQPVLEFGGIFLNDTCWCLIGEPVVAREVRNIITNSGKYAHYGPAAVQRGFHFGSLERCVDAARTGTVSRELPAWLGS
jgi:predicted aconitase/predicted aconitase with swiveling domain